MNSLHSDTRRQFVCGFDLIARQRLFKSLSLCPATPLLLSFLSLRVCEEGRCANHGIYTAICGFIALYSLCLLIMPLYNQVKTHSQHI